MTLTEAQPGEVDLVGGPGAIGGDVMRLRVTSASAAVITSVSADGSFTAADVPAVLRTGETLYLEALTRDADTFLVAVTGGPTTAAVMADPGPDRDSDMSPDAIDCAPDDDTLGGQRCTCSAEVCDDALDNDCDGMIDESMCAELCTVDSDCRVGEMCNSGICVPI